MLRTSVNRNPVLPNIEDVKSLMAYTHYLIMNAQLAGNLCFDGHRPSKEEVEIAEKCRATCSKISRALATCKIYDIPELLDYYDMAYRIGNKSLPNSIFLKGHKQRVYNAWKAGDKKIADSTIYGMLLSEVLFHPEKANRDHILAINAIKTKWISILKKNDYFPGVTAYENYQRLALIMRQNLDEGLGFEAESIKRRWYERNKIDDLKTVSSLILKSYRRFISSLFPAVLDYESQISLDNQILSELSTRSDLLPHDREAFRLAMEFNKVIMQ